MSVDLHRLASLGEAIFFDSRLSSDRAVSCASCHKPDHYFADNVAVSVGAFEHSGTRNTPSLIGAARQPELFWDGRRSSLLELVLDPLTNPVEHDLNINMLRDVVSDNYRDEFAAIFCDEDAILTNIVSAIAQYLSELQPQPSPFERFAYGEEVSALNEAQIRGYRLFVGAAECSTCHLIDSHEALLTDSRYHFGEISSDLVSQLSNAAEFVATLPIDQRFSLIAANVSIAALGRYTATLNPKDVGMFRTPSLRNVAVTAPYMHDGSVADLREAVEHEIYWRGGDDAHLGRLTPSQRSDVVAFLTSLTSEVKPGSYLLPLPEMAQISEE